MEKTKLNFVNGEQYPGSFVQAALQPHFDFDSRAQLTVEIVNESLIRISNGVDLTLPPVVGTGMQGRLRRMTNAIYRATYIKVSDNLARISTVHGLDVGKAVLVALERPVPPGRYTVTARPISVNELVDALAKRLNNKRLAQLSPRRARLWATLLDFLTLGHADARKALDEDTADALVGDADRFADVFGFVPRNPAEYLATHNYGPDDI